MGRDPSEQDGESKDNISLASKPSVPEPAMTRTSPLHRPEPIDSDLEASRTRSPSVESHEDDQGPLPARPRPTSKASSFIVREAVKVPRNQRRGLLARFAVISEVENPYDLPNKTKWIITLVVALAGAAAPMGSTIVFPSLVTIATDFHSTPVVTNMSVAFYMLSMSIFPLWWSSFSETLGRRTIYITSFALFLVFNILSALSVNIAMFIVMRILSGGASASVQAVGAGTVADVWEVKERGRAMGYFYLGPLCGPLIAPILGGALGQTLGWRAALWSQVIFGAALWIAILLCLPETLKNRKSIVAAAEAEAVASGHGADDAESGAVRPALTRTSTRQSTKVQAKKYTALLRRCFLDPLKIILHLRNPPVAVTVYYAAVTFSVLYFMNVSLQQTFHLPPYGYNTLVVGLTYIPNSIGYFLASMLGGSWVDRIMKREAAKAGRIDEKGKPIFRPEDRMRENIWIAAFMYPLAIMCYGWTSDKGVNIAVPMISNFFFGIGSMLVFGCCTTMLTEFMPNKSSHGIAANNFVRNIFSCIGGLVAEPAITKIGNGWLFTILGTWTLLSGIVVVWAMKHYANRWHEDAERAAKEEKEHSAAGR